MGGPGSSRWYEHEKKITTAACRVLDIRVLTIERTLRENVYTSRRLQGDYIDPTKDIARLAYTVNTKNMLAPWIQLSYTLLRTQEYVEYRVALSTILLCSGGLRWYFQCPLSINGIPCNRRVCILYLPPGARYFACRDCHDLTYKSCQESHVYDRVYAEIAVRYGTSVQAAKQAFR